MNKVAAIVVAAVIIVAIVGGLLLSVNKTNNVSQDEQQGYSCDNPPTMPPEWISNGAGSPPTNNPAYADWQAKWGHCSVEKASHDRTL